MNEKTRNMIQVLAGGYLIYLGGSLCKNVLESRPNNYILYILAGVFFVIVGGVLIIMNLKLMKDSSKQDIDIDADEETTDEETIDEETADEEITDTETTDTETVEEIKE
ncbi:MAG: hypothetical protein RR399_05730 [Lachnospiraceae bacterium]